MAMRFSSRFTPNDENAAKGKSAQKSVAAASGGLKSAPLQRPKLSNITNKLQQHPPATPKIRNPRTPLKNISNQTPLNDSASALKPLKQQVAKLPQPKALDKVSTRDEKKHQQEQNAKRPPIVLTEEQELWAKAGVEKVHFTGDDMEALREKIEQEEVENRVKTILSFRTEIFPVLPRPQVTDSPYQSNGQLKLDSYEEKPREEYDNGNVLDMMLLDPELFEIPSGLPNSPPTPRIRVIV